MKKIHIKFLFFDDKICGRCKTTDDFLNEAIREFKQQHPDIVITLDRENSGRKILKSHPPYYWTTQI